MQVIAEGYLMKMDANNKETEDIKEDTQPSTELCEPSKCQGEDHVVSETVQV